MGRSWGGPGGSWGALGGLPGGPGSVPGGSWGILGPSWANSCGIHNNLQKNPRKFNYFWGPGRVPGRSPRHLGASGRRLEASWRPLGHVLAHLGRKTGRSSQLGGLLEASWTRLGGLLERSRGAGGRKRGGESPRGIPSGTLFLAHSKAPEHEKRRRVCQKCMADGIMFPWAPLINRFHRFRSRRKGPGHASRSSAVADKGVIRRL